MFDNVMETSVRPVVVADSDEDVVQASSAEPTPVKKTPTKRKLGPKPAAEKKRKAISSDSESSPIKKKVRSTRKVD
jgi:hypothetical protein